MTTSIVIANNGPEQVEVSFVYDDEDGPEIRNVVLDAFDESCPLYVYKGCSVKVKEVEKDS